MHFLIILQVLSVLSTPSAAIAIHRGRGLEPSQDVALEGPSADAFYSESPTLYLTIPAKNKKTSTLPKVKRSPPGKQSGSSSAEAEANRVKQSSAQAATGEPPAKVASKPHSYANVAGKSHSYANAAKAAAKPHSYANAAANQAAQLRAQVANQVGPGTQPAAHLSAQVAANQVWPEYVNQAAQLRAQVANQVGPATKPHSYAKQAAQLRAQVAANQGGPGTQPAAHLSAQVAANQVGSATKPHSYAKQAAQLRAQVAANQVGHAQGAEKSTGLQSGATTSEVTLTAAGPSSPHAEGKPTELAPATSKEDICKKITTCEECVNNKKCKHVFTPKAQPEQYCIDINEPRSIGVSAKSVQHCDYFDQLKVVEDKDRARVTSQLKNHVTNGNGMSGRHMNHKFYLFITSKHAKYTADLPPEKITSVALIVYHNYRLKSSQSKSGVIHTVWDDSHAKYNWHSVVQMCQIAAHYSPGASGTVVVPNSINGLPICIRIVTAVADAPAEEAQAASKTCFPVAKTLRPDQQIGSSCE